MSAPRPNPLLSDRDVDFQLYEVLDAARLCTLPAFAEHSRDTFALLLDSTRRFARENRLTHAAVLDVNLEARRPQLELLGARRIATVPVQAPVFGLRISRGQPEKLHVYRLAPR